MDVNCKHCGKPFSHHLRRAGSCPGAGGLVLATSYEPDAFDLAAKRAEAAAAAEAAVAPAPVEPDPVG